VRLPENRKHQPYQIARRTVCRQKARHLEEEFSQFSKALVGLILNSSR
jgi:hypothetical protein